MENLSIEPGNKTPLVKCTFESGLIEFQGRSIPENSIEFYHPVYEWIDRYATMAKSETNVHIQLEYFNTSSSKCLLDIFKKLQLMHQSGNSKVLVTWFYEEDDEDMLEAGEDYQAIIKVPFTMKKLTV
jgi:hypothetical protein